MGNTQQSSTSSSLSQYQFLKPLSQDRSLYRNLKTSKQYISLERTFPNHDTIKEYEQRYGGLLQMTHPYLLNETEHVVVTASTICSMQHRVVHFFQYSEHTLGDELAVRGKHGRGFQEKEIWSILCSAVLVMAHLTKNDIPCFTIHPKDIVIDSNGMIKILSPLLTQASNPQHLTQQLYPSPQHLKSLKTQTFTTLTNKSCVFSLGVTLLHILTLEPMDWLYDYEKLTVDVEALNGMVDKVELKEVREVLRKMVKAHGYDRVTFTELEEMLYHVLEGELGEGEGQVQTDNRLKQSIKKVYQSNVTQQSKPQSYNTGISYHTGTSTTTRSLTPSSNYLTPLLIDTEDIPNKIPIQSSSDHQNIDQQDSNSLHPPQTNQSYPTHQQPSSRVSYSDINQLHSSRIHHSQTYHALQQQSLNHINTPPTLHNPSQKSSIKNPNPHPTPYHVRQHLTRGIYQGYKLNNMRQGYGVFHYIEGGRYAGHWVANKMHGTGALYYANGQLAYEGQWQNDRLHGYGVLYNEQPEVTDREIDYRSLHLVENQWVRYEGRFKEDEKDGEGTWVFGNGECFRGWFQDDLPHGKGVYQCRDGNLVKGNWILGMMQ